MSFLGYFVFLFLIQAKFVSAENLLEVLGHGNKDVGIAVVIVLSFMATVIVTTLIYIVIVKYCYPTREDENPRFYPLRG